MKDISEWITYLVLSSMGIFVAASYLVITAVVLRRVLPVLWGCQ